MSFKVVITDIDLPSIEPELAVLSGLPADVVSAQCRSPEEVLEIARDADALLVQYAPITKGVIQGLTRCRVIARYGIGIDTIDLEAAAQAGIPVCNVPDYCIDEVAEHTVALLFACARQITRLNSSTHAGNWSVTAVASRIERLSGQKLGLVGFGSIARAVAARAQAMGLTVSAFDPYMDEATIAAMNVEKAFDLPSLLQAADFVSLHVPLTAATKQIIGAEELRLMKPSAYLINTARGPLIDEESLYAALVQGEIAGAALDVLEKEPPTNDYPLMSLDNVIVTPHAAFYSKTSLVELQTKTAEAVARVLSGEPPRWVVNGVTGKRDFARRCSETSSFRASHRVPGTLRYSG